MHRILEKLRFGDAPAIVQRRFRLGLGRSRILFGEKPMGGQMQNVGRMDLKQRVFCRLLLGEFVRLPVPVGELFNQFITFLLRAF